MKRFLFLLMGVLLMAGLLTACSDDGGGTPAPTTTTVTTDASGATTKEVTATASGASVTIPQGTVFKDSTGAILTGTLTITVTYDAAPANPPAGATAGAFAKVTVTSDKGVVAAKASSGVVKSADQQLNNALPVTLAITTDATALPIYSSADGKAWTSEGKLAAISSGKATFDITTLTKPYWGVFVIPTTTAAVSGTVATSSTTVSKAALITDGVAVQITSFDKAGEKLGEAAVTSNSAGGFLAQLKLSGGGGYLMVVATKEGYTQFQKRIDYTTPGNIELRAVLEAAKVAFATPGSPLKSGLSSSTEPSFNFALVRLSDGTKKAVAGSAIAAAKAAGATTEVGIEIPAASVPGVAKLRAEMNTYEPATQSDRFPGSYTGVDGSGREGKMISLAFDSLNISDADSGKGLGDVAKALVKSGVRKAADKTTTITRHIYSSSCDNLFIEDYGPATPGWQVPVWTLNPNSGKWVYIGTGTIVDSSGNVIASPTKTACGGNDYYLKILVANEEFAKYWWNLDHIIFDQPTEVCIEGTFSYSDGSPFASQGLSLYGNNIDGTYGTTGSDGKYKLNTVLLNKDNTDRKAKISYYNENGGWVEQNVTVGSAPCGSFSKADFQKPCKVSGKLVDADNNPVPYRGISLQGSNFYRWAYSDANGAFSSLVKCSTSIDIFAGSDTKAATFNVNSTLTADEKTDANAEVVLNDITIPNSPPTGYGYFPNRSILLNKTLSALLSAYDEEGNYPISWTLTVGSATKTGSIDATTSLPVQADFTGLTAGEYAASLKVKDSKGAERTVALGTVTVSDGSRAPVVNLNADRSYVSTCSQTRIVNLFGSASDPDGDALSGAWSLEGGTAPSCSGGTGTGGYISATCAATVPPTAGTYTYTYRYTVTDNNAPPKSGFKTVSITAQNGTPYTSALRSDKTLVEFGATGDARTVTLTASANDPDGDAITGAWTVGGSPICSNASGTGTISNATCTYTIPTAATLGQTFTFRFTPSDCVGAGSYREVTVTYGTAADVTVVVQ